jgi:hypothetical protein
MFCEGARALCMYLLCHVKGSTMLYTDEGFSFWR